MTKDNKCKNYDEDAPLDILDYAIQLEMEDEPFSVKQGYKIALLQWVDKI